MEQATKVQKTEKSRTIITKRSKTMRKSYKKEKRSWNGQEKSYVDQQRSKSNPAKIIRKKKNRFQWDITNAKWDIIDIFVIFSKENFVN